jgi:sugar transferase (PEP-CTERM/EpsH1 system associated)
MIDDPRDIKHVATLQEMVQKVFYEVRTPLAMKLKAAGSLLTGDPFTKPCFYSTRLQKSIDDYLDNHDVRAVLCFCSSAAEYVFRSRHYRTTLQQKVLLADLVDVDSEKWRQYAGHKSGVMRWLYNREANCLRPYEQHIIDSFDRTFLVSEEEKGVLGQYGSTDKVEALTNGVDLDYFTPKSPAHSSVRGSGNRLVFSGAMDYWPNIEGAVWFANNVFPQVLKAFPDSAFCIAGRNPDDAILALKNRPGIEVTGTVPDIRACLASAAICVAPLQIARGIQNKVLEGMAMGKAVVATPGAATGLKAVPDEEIVVSGSEADFAKAVITLLNNPEERQKIGTNARAYVESHHSWDAQLGMLGSLIDAGKKLRSGGMTQ